MEFKFGIVERKRILCRWFPKNISTFKRFLSYVTIVYLELRIHSEIFTSTLLSEFSNIRHFMLFECATGTFTVKNLSFYRFICNKSNFIVLPLKYVKTPHPFSVGNILENIFFFLLLSKYKDKDTRSEPATMFSVW